MHVGSRRSDGVNCSRPAIDADMGLHTEVPLVALLGLMHFGIALLVGVLRRAWCTDDCRIDDRSRGHLDSVLSQKRVDRRKELFSKLVFLQQMPEFAHSGLIGRSFAP